MIYYVTETFLKQKTPITKNVDASDLAPFIEMSVKAYLEPILGYNFNKELLTKFNNNTLNTIETELVDFLQYVVSFYAAYDSVPHVTFRFSAKGIQSQFGEFTGAETIQTVEFVQQSFLSFARIYEARLRSFLALNKESFPTYLSSLNREIEAPDQSNEPQTSIGWL